MKKLFIIIAFMYSSQCLSGEYIYESSASSNIKEIIFTDGSKFSLIEVHGSWTDNLGRYGSTFCYGKIEGNKEGVNLEATCEQKDDKGNKFWTALIRQSDMDAGAGKATYIDATGPYINMIGITCNYAVKYLEKLLFYKQRCNIPEDIYKILRDYK